ncbi:MAG: DinB family protein [Spirosomaceae bacterium]|nr:DinB family protein [Spirosomataceae bacterium]
MTTQKTPTEISTIFTELMNGYMAALDRYTDEQFFYKSDPEVWSLGQMYEHLFTSSNYFFLANIARCLEQRKGQIGGDKNKWGDNIFQYGGMPPIKVKVPEAVRGPEPVAKSRDEYRVLFAKIVSDAQSITEAVANDAGEYKAMHPAFGWLNAHEWYHCMEMHHRHHLRQQQELEELSDSTTRGTTR